MCGTRRTGRWREVVGRGGVREDWCDVCYQHKKKYVSPTHVHPFTSSPLYSFTPLLLYSFTPLLLCSFTPVLLYSVTHSHCARCRHGRRPSGRALEESRRRLLPAWMVNTIGACACCMNARGEEMRRTAVLCVSVSVCVCLCVSVCVCVCGSASKLITPPSCSSAWLCCAVLCCSRTARPYTARDCRRARQGIGGAERATAARV